MPPKRDQVEHGLSHWVDLFLERALLPPCWFTAVDTGTYRPGITREQWMAAEQKRRAMGIKPHHLDWYVYQRATGIYVQFELKVAGRPTLPGQDQTLDALHRNKIAACVCETVPSVYTFLSGEGFQLHGNAFNIAAELHERYLAQRREKAAPPKPKRASRTKATPRHTAPGGFARRAAARGILI